MADIKKKFDFNNGLEELEAIVKKMESGDLTLEENLQHFERGIKLSKECKKALDNAEQKIINLSADSDYQR